MSYYSYVMLLQVFTLSMFYYIFMSLTCMNVPIKFGHMTIQNICCFADSYIINHTFIYVGIS